MPRTPSLNSSGNVEWTEKASSPDGDNLIISLELDAVDSGSGFVQENKDSSNISWLNFSTSSNIQSDGSRDFVSTVEVDPNEISTGNSYRFNLTASDDFITSTRTIILEVISTEGNILVTSETNTQYPTLVKYSAGSSFDVGSLSEDSRDFVSVNPTNEEAMAMGWSMDGTVLLIGTNRDPCYLYKFEASTPWDPATLSKKNHIDASSLVLNGRINGIEFIDGDEEIIVADNYQNLWHQWSWTKYDITGISRSNSTNRDYDKKIVLRNDGQKLFAGKTAYGQGLAEYTLSTPYNIGSASEENTKDIDSIANNIQGIELNGSGTKIMVLENQEIHEWDLSTPYNLSTAGPLTTYSIPDNPPSYSLQGLRWD